MLGWTSHTCLRAIQQRIWSQTWQVVAVGSSQPWEIVPLQQLQHPPTSMCIKILHVQPKSITYSTWVIFISAIIFNKIYDMIKQFSLWPTVVNLNMIGLNRPIYLSTYCDLSTNCPHCICVSVWPVDTCVIAATGILQLRICLRLKDLICRMGDQCTNLVISSGKIEFSFLEISYQPNFN